MNGIPYASLGLRPAQQNASNFTQFSNQGDMLKETGKQTHLSPSQQIRFNPSDFEGLDFPTMIIINYTNYILIMLTDSGAVETWVEAFSEDIQNNIYGTAVRFGNRDKEIYQLYARIFIQHISKTRDCNVMLAISLRSFDQSLPNKHIIEAFKEQAKF